MREDSKYYGKKVEYDPLWQGPLQKCRTSTDFFCLIIFSIWAILWIAIAIYAFATGSLQNLAPPVDSEGRRCGIDLDVAERPYLLLFDVSKCDSYSCQTTQSCVSKCPTTNFLYKSKVGDLEKIKPNLICKLGVDINSISSWDVLDKYMKKQKCARLYLNSKSTFKRCIPESIPDKFKEELPSNTIEKIEQFVRSQLRKESQLVDVVKAFSNTKYQILGFIVLATVLALLYICVLRWFTKVFVYFSIFLVCALIFFFICQAALTFSSDNNQKGALTVLIVSVIILVLIILFTIFLWRKINLACDIISESCKAMLSLPSTVLFPILPFLQYIAIASFAILVTLYLVTIIEPVFKVKMSDDGCSCPAYLQYDEEEFCDPYTFKTQCKIGNNRSCFDSGCRFSESTTPGYVTALYVIHGFSFLWATSFISAFSQMVLAGTFATWYWTENKKFVPKFALLNNLGITVRYHLGSLALGSLILTIVQVIKMMVNSLKSRSSRGGFAIFRCIIDVIENAVNFLTRYTYIMIAIHGQNFFKSAKDTFNLVMRNILNVIVVNQISDWILLFGVLLITGFTTTMAWVSFNIYRESATYSDTEIPVLLYSTGFSAFFITCIVIEVLKTAIDTIFICFLEDFERNDGSEARPYFLNYRFRQLLQKNL